MDFFCSPAWLLRQPEGRHDQVHQRLLHNHSGYSAGSKQIYVFKGFLGLNDATKLDSSTGFSVRQSLPNNYLTRSKTTYFLTIWR